MTELTVERLECVEVIVTADNADWLAAFTRRLVEDHLVACGHNITPIRAIYRWDNAIHDEPQSRVSLHTRASLVSKIALRTADEHADEVPCVLAMPIAGGNADYLRWVYDETAAAVTDPAD